MRLVRTMVETGIILGCTFLLAGCKEETLASAATNELSINMSAETDMQAERSSQSLWFVIDEQGKRLENLPSDSSDVEAVNSVITKHSDVVDNFDYHNLKEGDELAFYAEPFINSLKQVNYTQALQNMYRNNKIVIEQNQLAWYEMAFYKDMKTVRVKTESEIVIKECSEDYLEQHKLKKNQVYSQARIVDLQKENEIWKITKIDKGPYVAKLTTAGGNNS